MLYHFYNRFPKYTFSSLLFFLLFSSPALGKEKLQDILDIKKPVIITWDWRPLAGGVLLLAVLLGAGWGAYSLSRYWLRRRRLQDQQSLQPLLSPEEEALSALKELQKERLIESGNARLFCSRVSEILRRYLGRRYHFGAEEQTSEELKKYLERKDIGEKPFEMVKNVLIESDLVKFAKYVPSKDVMEDLLQQIKEIINSTGSPTASEPVRTESKTKHV